MSYVTLDAGAEENGGLEWLRERQKDLESGAAGGMCLQSQSFFVEQLR